MQIKVSPSVETFPVFIVGCVRSGTTLLRSILGSHPTMCIPRETGFFSLISSPFAQNLNIGKRDDFIKFINWYVSQRRFEYQEIDKVDFLNRLMEQTDFSFRSVLDQLMKIEMERSKKVRWGEKTPGHEFYIKLIFQLYPNAKVIYLIRDPRAVSASLKNVPWGGKFIGSHIKIWKESVVEAENWRNEPRVKIIRYEDLVSDVEFVMRHICSFIELPFTTQMIVKRDAYQSHEGTDWTSQYENSVAKKITTENLDKWKHELSFDEIQLIEHFTKKEFDRWGYKSMSENSLSIYLVMKYYAGFFFAMIRSRIHLIK